MGKASKTSRRRGKRIGPPKPGPAAALFGDSALESIVAETVSLFHRLRVVAEQIHRQGEFTSGKGGILRGLDVFGPQTVPQMARARPVSRQYIQTLVNLLAQEGHIEFIDNPAHRRSRLVRLTPKGKALVDAMIRRQAKLFAQLKLDIAEKDLRAAAKVLRAVRELFQSDRWKRLLKTVT